MRIPKLDWPDDIQEVECVNFSQPLMYNLMVGIDHERVTYVSHRVSSWYRTYVFDYLGFRYELETEQKPVVTLEGNRLSGEESIEVPYRLTKIARLDVDDDGETIIDEKYPIAMAKLANATRAARYEDSWGSF